MTGRKLNALVATLMLSGAIASASPVLAAGLVGGLLDSVGDAVSVQSGDAGHDSQVNVGVGDNGSGGVASVNIGGDTSASVGSSGGNTTASLNLGGGMGSTGISIGSSGVSVGSTGINIGTGNPGGPGSPSGPGGPGTPGGPGSRGTTGGSGGFGFFGGGSRSIGDGGAAACSITEARQVVQNAARVNVARWAIAKWASAYGVQVVPVRLCASTRAQVAKVLMQNQKMYALRGAAAADSLISASLRRAKYGPDRVFSIVQRGRQIYVYVF